MAVAYGYDIALQDDPFVPKEQSSAFVRGECTLVVRSDSLDSIMTIARNFEGRPIRLAEKSYSRLLSCSRLRIRSLSYWPSAIRETRSAAPYSRIWCPAFPAFPLSKDGSRSGAPRSLRVRHPKRALVLAPRVPAIQRQPSFWLPAFPMCLLSKDDSRSGSPRFPRACYPQPTLVFGAPHSLCAHYPPQPAPEALQPAREQACIPLDHV
ncbi:hypothetical protein EDC04DRAFT_3137434 [Pisolithus marmoratus]|nr:hypothetical protein EDC04DRAFT_3137434 [Pisolithus marmoratus]